MLRTTHEFENYAIEAVDGEVGHLKDFYFDDEAWVIRYLVVETGAWLSSRKVLISPVSLIKSDWVGRVLPASITREQVRNSPDIDTVQPVSRQNEEAFMRHYGYPNYWGGEGMWGGGMDPCAMVPGDAGSGLDRVEREREMGAQLRAEQFRHRNDDPHLRSCKAVTGYHIQANDGSIGHVVDYLIDRRTWAIRYLVVDTGNWWMGHKVLVAPHWIDGVHWSAETVSVDLARDALRTAPVYDPYIDGRRDQDCGFFRHDAGSGERTGAVLSTGNA